MRRSHEDPRNWWSATRLLLLSALVVLVPAQAASASLDAGTPPEITYTLTGTPGDNNWWRSNVTVHWTVQPQENLVETVGCDPALLVVGDVAGTTRRCVATWNDGGETTISKTTTTIKIDATPPNVSGSAGRPPGSGGWYNAPVTVSFGGTDAMSGLIAGSCTTTRYDGPDDANAAVAGTCRDNAGNVGSDTLELAYDSTAPQVGTATPDRGPDIGSWYNHEVLFTVTSTGDNLSGTASCPTVPYDGPNGANAAFNAHCVDYAGNVGSKQFSLAYDSTGPAVKGVPGRRPYRYGWYNRPLTVRFEGTDPVSGVSSCTEARYTGPTSARAEVAGACTDGAGNTTEATFTFKFADPFLTPENGSRVSSPPLANWPAVANAKYYNFQLWHNGKILSRWPRKSQIQLDGHWRFAGHFHRLAPGRYDWYVWPRIKGRYRALLGHGYFYKRAG